MLAAICLLNLLLVTLHPRKNAVNFAVKGTEVCVSHNRKLLATT